MSKYTEQQAGLMSATARELSGLLAAAFWVENPSMRDFLVDEGLKVIDKALAVIGKRISDVPAEVEDVDGLEGTA